MKDFIRQRLIEAIKSRHWKEDSWPDRIWLSNFGDLGPEHKAELNKRVKFLESLEFGKNDKIGIWLYESPVLIKHKPYTPKDKGTHLLAIMNGNTMTTIYWKHIREGEYTLDIDYNELVELSQSKFYDPDYMPIDIGTIEMFRESKRQSKSKVKGSTPKPNPNKFKKLKLNNGQVIKYYQNTNKFETLEGQPIKIDDIFDELPAELQDRVMELLENRR